MEKNKGLIFVMFHVLFVSFVSLGHENWRKFKHLIFVKFRVPGVMTIAEN